MLLYLQVEQMLGSEEYGKDLSSVQNLLKKHQLLEADVAAHEVICYVQCYLEDNFYAL